MPCRLLVVIAFLLLGAVPALAVDFVHDAHLEYVPDGACSTCHMEDAVSVVPDTKVCLECHDNAFLGEVVIPGTVTHGPLWPMNHRPYAKGNTYDCSVCHQQDFCLECHKSGFADEMGDFGNEMSNVHTSDFHITHPLSARTDPQRCASCHENQFCVDCHEDFAPQDLAVLSHRRGFTDGTLGGVHATFAPEQCQGCHTDSVLPTHEWSNQHAREARKNLATCQACHPSGDICLTCHSARTGLGVSPHPDGWDDIKGRLDRASDGKTCRKCH